MAEKHFYEQQQYTKDYLLPYFQKYIPDFSEKKVLEIGCAEGGLLEVLHNLKIYSVGLEISKERVEIAKSKNKNLKIIVGDITDKNLAGIIKETFDVIIMREVIEHIIDKKQAFVNISKMLNKNGYLFISFPPKYSPFAGHQQIGKSFLKAVPYLHLLPETFLKSVSRKLGESANYIDEIKLHYSTGCTIREFEFHSEQHNFISVKKDLFLFRPIYSQRYGVPVIKLPKLPMLSEYISLGCEVLLQKV